MLACTKHKNITVCLEEAELLQLEGRDKNALFSDTNDGCPFLSFKKQIINIRRGDTKTFPNFKLNIEQNLDFWVRSLNVRWLVSVCDCYIDCGTPDERAQAAIVMTFVNVEKANYIKRLNLKTMSPFFISKTDLENLDKNIATVPYRHGPDEWVDLGNGLFFGKRWHLNKDFYENTFRRINSSLTKDVFKRIFNACYEKLSTFQYFSFSIK